MRLFKKKNFDDALETSSASGLSKSLTAFDLVILGLGSIIGTGVFVLTGLVASTYSGPAVTISYMIAGSTCILVALVYAELATMLPTSGGVYTYSYVAFGEFFAWMVGSVLIIEFGFGVATVSSGWSSYIVNIVKAYGINIPNYFVNSPFDGGYFNVPASFILLVIGWVLYLGTKDSKRLNAMLVFIKMFALLLFVVFAIPKFNIENLSDFVPFGYNNVIVGGSMLFFAYTGFGALAASAEECKNPKRDLTIGIIVSLLLAIIIYVIVSGLAVGGKHYSIMDNSNALMIEGNKIITIAISLGAISGMTTVMLMQLYGLSRMFYVISRDGLVPKFLSRLHPKYQSPYSSVIFFTIFGSLVAGLLPFQIISQLASMGALMDYIFVTIAAIIFRFILPNQHRPFKCPFIFIIAPTALIACIYLLMKQVLSENFNLLVPGKILIIWFILMLFLYLIRVTFFRSSLPKYDT